MNYRLSNWLTAACGVWLLMLSAPALAATTGADTDLFASTNSQVTTNIIFIVDNAAAGSAASSETCNIDSSGNVTTTGSANPTSLSGTTIGTVQCALYAAVTGVTPNDKLSIAIMMFNEGQKSFNPDNSTSSETGGSFSSDCPGGGDKYGGCLVVPKVTFTANVKAQLLYWIKNWNFSGSGDRSIKGPTAMGNGAALQETWAYIQGKTGVSGRVYSTALTECKNFVVFVGNAYRNNMTQGDRTGDKGPKDPLYGSSSVSGKNANPAASTGEKTVSTDTVTARYNVGSSTLTCSAGGSSSYTFTTAENTAVYGLGWAKYMFNKNEIRTYSIGYLSSDCKADYPAWLDRLAYNGSAQFFPTNDYATLKAAFDTVFSQVISINSVFASVSLPVSVNTQGSYLNQVYIGMFRPTSGYLPRWYGNLKQYKLAFVGADLKLVDANGTQAVNTATGFITECARSFWTPSTVDTYWSGYGTGSCATITGASESNYPDGNVVEKGAQAYVQRTYQPQNRVVKTCRSGIANCDESSDLVDFNTSLSTTNYGPTLFDLSDASYTDARNNLIEFGRGQNNLSVATGLQASDNELTKGYSDASGNRITRASVHGDVMHSRPVAINFGTDASPQVVVFYGSNDGMLRAVNGNQTSNLTYGVSSGSGFAPGQELWSFMPPEFYGNLKRLYVNTQQIYFADDNASNDAGQAPKPYGMDGPVSSFQGTIGSTNKAYIFSAMRRGGRALYAFDVTTPGSPSLLWKVGCGSSSLTSSDCTSTSGNSAYSSIGQTWGTAKLIYVAASAWSGKPLLLMAGGYDTCEDTDSGSANHACSGSASKGSKVYVIDASTGNIVRDFDTVVPSGTSGAVARSIISDATVVPDSVTGKAKYAYMADIGGVVYRLNFEGTSANDWSMTPIAKLGCGTDTAGSGKATSSCNANRKFMFQPSVVSKDGQLFWILLGSGDREKPVSQHTASGAVKNYFFAIQDKPGTSTWLTDQNATCDANLMCLDSLQKVDGTNTTTTSSEIAGISSKRGWYLTLSSTEQVVTSAITVYGNTSFSTHMPATSSSSSSTCANNLGSTRVYNVDYSDASPTGDDSRYDDVTGDGLPPSPVAGKVLIDGVAVPFCIGCSKDSPLEGKKIVQSSSISRARNRLYWYIQKN
jgi:type IV pilus assembly protein PilY1